MYGEPRRPLLLMTPVLADDDGDVVGPRDSAHDGSGSGLAEISEPTADGTLLNISTLIV
jgi:hypothetical protein